MVITPTWNATVSGESGNAGQINQFLGAHTSTWEYANGGVLQAQQSTAVAIYQSTYQTYLSQVFTTGAAQTAIGQVKLRVSVVNGSAISQVIPPLTLSLYLDSGGIPTGSLLSSISIDEISVAVSTAWLTLPLNVNGLTPSTAYNLVLSPQGTSTTYYVWQQSNQTFGAATSGDGVTWNMQSYGFTYQIYDTSANGSTLISFLVDDAGARQVQVVTNALGQVTQLIERVQIPNGSFFTSTRNLTYTTGLLTGVA